MNFIEYVIVTAISKNDLSGAQLVSGVGQLSGKNYVEVELMSLKGITSIPKTGDFILMLTLGQKEFICLGVLEKKDMKLEEEEIKLHTETGENKMMFDVDGNIKLNSGKEGKILLNCSGDY